MLTDMIARNGAPALPLFHLYGDPPDDQAFDFIHIERIASRSAAAR
jgi:AraC family transcriptional activator of pobA